MGLWRRELYGRGLIGSLKASTWYQQLQEKQGQGKQRRKVKVNNAVRVQVRLAPDACTSLAKPAAHTRVF